MKNPTRDSWLMSWGISIDLDDFLLSMNEWIWITYFSGPFTLPKSEANHITFIHLACELSQFISLCSQCYPHVVFCVIYENIRNHPKHYVMEDTNSWGDPFSSVLYFFVFYQFFICDTKLFQILYFKNSGGAWFVQLVEHVTFVISGLWVWAPQWV